MAQNGSFEEGVALMRQSLTGRAALGVSWYHVRYLCMLATTLHASGATKAAFRVIAEAKDQAARHDEHMWDAELERTEAEFARPRSAKECEAFFLSALATARRQNAESFELRAAVGLARFWSEQGDCAESRDLLGSVYDSFTEGFDTRDLTQARQLLDRLH